MKQAAAGRKSHPTTSLATNLIAGLIFVIFSSCLPQSMDVGANQSATPRRSSSSGDSYGASNTSSFESSTQGSTSGSGVSGGLSLPSNSGGVVNSGGSASATNSSNSSNGVNNAITNTTSECYKGDEFFCKVERLIGEKTNKYRQGRGLKLLELDAKIAFVARDWSQKQARSGSIGHSGFPSARMAVYRQEFNVSRSLHGENVAMTGRSGGSARDDAAAERVAQEFAVMWWNSSGHRANMLGNFKNLGVGVHQTSGGSWYATQIFE